MFCLKQSILIIVFTFFCIAESFACLNPKCEFNLLDNPDINLEEPIDLTTLAFENNMELNSYCMEIKWVADYSYYSIYGGNVASQVATILNGVENIFNNSGISLSIKNEGSLAIYTSPGSDPYSNPSSLPCHPGYPNQGCVSIARVLYEFENNYGAVAADAVLLFTSQLLSNHGVANTQYLCTGMSRAIGLSHHKTSGSSLSNTVRSAIMAHELIHIIRQDGLHDTAGASLMSPAGPNNGWTTIRSIDKTEINSTISTHSCFSCSTASCNDGIQNQGETQIDCGGPYCAACPTCSDGIQNQGETQIDCGGPYCQACSSCSDGIQNQGETGIDCGGPYCLACPTCSDGIQNQGEIQIDCGGPYCLACPSCSDGIQNQGETGIDCGGPFCQACLPGDCTTIDGTYSGTYSGTAIYKAPNFMVLSFSNNQAIIPSGANIEMSGGRHVDLTPGFRALPGSTYKAYINDCAN